MASIKISADYVQSIIGESEDNGGTQIELKNGRVLFIEKEWTIIFKEIENKDYVLVEI